MIPTKKFNRIALCLILLLTAFTITLTNATTENNYKTDNNFLTNISETTHIENGYKTNIIINPTTTGVYATEGGYKLHLSINPQGIGGSLEEDSYKLNLIPEKTFPEVTVIGDINDDFRVDIKDLVLVIKYFGAYRGSDKWNDAMSKGHYPDVNGDNKVDIKDLVLVIKHFGEHYP